MFIKYSYLFTVTFFLILIQIKSIHKTHQIKFNKTENLKDEIIDDNEYKSMFVIDNINCTKTICPDENICIDTNKCKCAHGFANLGNPEILCQYQQKKQLYSFFLEILFLGGMGHFYAGRILQGLLKLLFILILPILLFIGSYMTKWNPIVLIISTVVCSAIIIWHLVDIILIGMNKYMDGNGIPLVKW